MPAKKVTPKSTDTFGRDDPQYPGEIEISDADIKKAILAQVAGNDISVQIIGEMLSAETIEEMLAGALDTAALVGKTFALKSWKWATSKFGPKGKGVFAVMEVTILPGTDKVITTGSANIMAALLWFQEKKETPPPLTVKESETSAGNTVYRLAIAA